MPHLTCLATEPATCRIACCGQTAAVVVTRNDAAHVTVSWDLNDDTGTARSWPVCARHAAETFSTLLDVQTPTAPALTEVPQP